MEAMYCKNSKECMESERNMNDNLSPRMCTYVHLHAKQFQLRQSNKRQRFALIL